MAKYRAVVEETFIARSPEKETPSLKMVFRTLFNLDTPNVPTEKQLFADLWLTENCLERTYDTLTEAFDWYGDNVMELHGTGALNGMHVDIVTNREDYKGKSYEKVAFINPVGGGKGTTETKTKTSDAQQIASAIRGKLIMYRQNKGITPPATTSAPAPRHAAPSPRIPTGMPSAVTPADIRQAIGPVPSPRTPTPSLDSSQADDDNDLPF